MMIAQATIDQFQIIAGVVAFLFASGVLYGVVRSTLFIANISNEATKGTAAAERAAISADKMEKHIERLDDIVVAHDHTLNDHRREMERIWKRLPKSETYNFRRDARPPEST